MDKKDYASIMLLTVGLCVLIVFIVTMPKERDFDREHSFLIEELNCTETNYVAAGGGEYFKIYDCE